MNKKERKDNHFCYLCTESYDMTATLHSIFSTLPFAVCLVWCIILVLRARTSGRDICLLACFAGVCTVLYFCHAVFFNGDEHPWVKLLYLCCNISVYPLFWLYIRSVSEPGRLGWRACWVLAPALLCAVCGIVSLASGRPVLWLELPVRGVFLLEVVLVCFFGMRRLAEYDRRVENFYADTDRKTLAPLRSLLFFFLLTSFLSAAAGVLGRELFASSLLLALPSLLFSTMLFSIFFVASRLEYTAEEMDAAAAAVSAGAAEEPVTEDMQALLERICALMESRQLFRTQGFKITDLATELGTNRTYVSNCINRLRGESFSDFVNSYRVRYAQILLQMNDSGKTIAQIGAEAGFTGDTSFFRNFKKITGRTPSEWLSDRDPS